NSEDSNYFGLSELFFIHPEATRLYEGLIPSSMWEGNNGYVGIGTLSPTVKLEVNGSVKISSGNGNALILPDGTTQTTAWTGVLCGGDYAESVGVSGERQRYEPGDVLVIDTTHSEGFAQSTEPYASTIAGIYSTKPGAIGRRTTDPDKIKSEIPMAMV